MAKLGLGLEKTAHDQFGLLAARLQQHGADRVFPAELLFELGILGCQGVDVFFQRLESLLDSCGRRRGHVHERQRGERENEGG